MKNPSSKYLKIGQAAKALGVSIDTLRRWEKAGKISAERTPGGTRLYSLVTLKKVNSGSVEEFQTSSISTEELLKRVSEPAQAGTFWESRDFESEEITKDSKPSSKSGQSFLTGLLMGTAVILAITLLITSWIAGSYLTNPKEAKQFFKNNVASGFFKPFHFLAQETIAVIDPKKAKELGFSEPEPPPNKWLAAKDKKTDVLAVTASSQFLEINSDTQINGSLSVRDAINGLSFEATTSAGTMAFNAGSTTLTVTKTAKLDQDVSSAASPSFNSITLSASTNQISQGSLNFTLPSVSGTLVTKTSTDTLTNKSMSGSDNTFTNIPNSALVNSKVTISAGTNLSGGGDVTLGSSVTIALKDSPTVTTLTTSGIVSLADGTAAAPALAFTNDLDTGLYRIGANKIGLITAGSATSGITIDASGNVGIGTISPGADLSVSGNVGIGFTASSVTAVPQLGLAVAGNIGIGTTTANNRLQVVGGGVFGANYSGYSAPSDGLLIEGNVGIGSTGGANYNLDIWGTSRITSALTVGGNVGVGASVNTASAGIFGSLGTTSLSVSGNTTLSTLTASGNIGIGGSASITGLSYALGGLRVNGYSDLTGNLGIGGTANFASTLYAQGSFFSINGSSTAPAFSFTASPNTGLWSPSSNALSLTTSGSATSGITITAAGNVGIGTTAPDAKLHLAGSYAQGTGGNLLMLENTTGAANMNSTVRFRGNSLDRFDIGIDPSSNGTPDFYIYEHTSGSYRLVVQNTSGNVGIGTTVPQAKLSIQGNVGIGYTGINQSIPVNGLAVFGNVGIGITTANSTLSVAGSGAFGSGYAGMIAPTNGLIIQGLVGIGNTAPGNTLAVNGGLNLGTFASSTGPSNGLAVSGNVGIGTTSPATALHVVGQTTVTNKILADHGSIDIGTTGTRFGTIYADTMNATNLVGTVIGGQTNSADWTINVDNATDDGEAMTLTFERGSATPNAVLGWDITNKEFDLNSSLNITGTIASTYGLTLTDTVYDLTSGTNQHLVLWPNGTGNVGIGTTAPNAKLEILQGANDTVGLRIARAEADGNPFLQFSDGVTYNNNIQLLAGTYNLAIAPHAGNVGIGTTSPGANLAVAGNAVFGFGATGTSIAGPSNGLAVSGNVGIGTTTTETMLNVVTTATGDNSMAQFVNRDYTTGDRTFIRARQFANANGSTSAYFGQGQDQKLYIINNDLNNHRYAMVLTNGGELGIGTTGPNSYLGVIGNAAIGATYGNIAAPTSSLIVEGNIGIGTSITNSNLSISGSAHIGSARQGISAPTDGMFVDGNVGIGATTSNNKLDVWGNARIAGTLTADGITSLASALTILPSTGNIGIGTTAPEATFQIKTIIGSDPHFAIADLDVDHGVTSATNTNDIFKIFPVSGTAGGAYLTGLADADGTALILRGIQSSNPTDSTPAIKLIGAKASGTITQDLGATETIFQVANNDEPAALTILGNGNVGIGTTNPTKTLYVIGTGSFSGNVDVASIKDTENGNYLLDPANTGTAFAIAGNAGIGTSSPLSLLSVAGGAHIGSVRQGISAPTDGLFVDGNVGIGATTSSNKLDVWGNARIAGTLSLDGNFTTNGTITPSGQFLAIDGSKTTPSYSFASSGNGDNGMYLPSANALSFATAGNDVLTITTAGWVGIGTTAPADKLQVVDSMTVGSSTSGNGTIRAGYANLLLMPGSSGNRIDLAQSGGGVYLSLGSDDSITWNYEDATANLKRTGAGIVGTDGSFWSAGNLGIGSTTPGAASLYVTGNAMIGYSSGAPASLSNGLAVSGNVGIGTTAPTNGTLEFGNATPKIYANESLQIITANNKTITLQSGSTITLNTNTGVTGTKIFNTSGNALSVFTATDVEPSWTYSPTGIAVSGVSEFAGNVFARNNFLVPSGNIGIGTTVPQAKLSIQGNVGIGYTGAGQAIPVNGLAVFGNVGVGTTTANSTLSVAGGAHIGSIRQGFAAPTDGLFVDGNVGIGATTSSNKLDIWGNTRIAGTLSVDSTLTNSSVFRADNGSASAPAYSFTSLTNAGLWSAGSGLLLTTGGSNTSGLTVTAAGYVGIGITSPAALLQSYKSTAGETEALRLTNPDGTAGSSVALTLYANDQYAKIAAIRTAANAGVDTVFSGLDGSGNLQEWMRINEGGNVGIGFTSPAFKLYVSGASGNQIGIDSTANTASSVVYRNNGGNKWELYNDGGTSNQFRFYSYGSAANVMTIEQGGNVGIGSAAGTAVAQLDLRNTNTSTGRLFYAGTSAGQFVILDNGNVGIGTTNPGATFEVRGGDNLFKIRRNTATNQFIQAGQDGTGFWMEQTGAEAGLDIMTFQTSRAGDTTNYATFKIDPAIGFLFNKTGTGVGNVGIGNAAPTGLLHVGNTGTPPLFVASSTGNVGIGTTGPESLLHIGDATTKVRLGKTYDGANGWAGARPGVVLDDGTVRASFQTDSVGATGFIGTETAHTFNLFTNNIVRMSVLSGGNIGIGITNPGANLATAGNAVFGFGGATSIAGPSNGLAILGNVGIGTTSPRSAIDIRGTGNTYLNIDSGAGNEAGILFNNNGSNKWEWYQQNDNFYIYSYTAASSVMTIKGSDGNVGIGSGNPVAGLFQVGNSGTPPLFVASSTGNVGIGTTNPGTKLEINGDLGFSGNNTIYMPRVDGTSRPMITRVSDTDQFQFSSIYENTQLGGDVITFYGWNGSATAEKMRITTAGNVGIGTSTANSNLSVAGGAHIGSVRQGISAPTDGLFVDGNVGIGATTSSNKLDVWGNARIGGTLTADGITSLGNTLTILPSTGYAGIGTTSPGSSLHVFGTGANLLQVGTATNYTKLSDNQLWSTGGALYINDSGTQNVYIATGGGNVGINTTGPDRKFDVLDASNPQLRLTQSDGSVYTDFQTNSSGYLTIKPTGQRVGIGDTPAATDTLLVKGTAGDANLRILANANTNSSYLSFEAGANTWTFRAMADQVGERLVLWDDTGSSSFAMSTSGNVGIGHSASATNSPGTFWVGPDAAPLAFFVQNTGNVGIGTTGPSAKLEISGGNLKMTSGNIVLNGNYLSGDGGNEGVFVTSTGLVGIGYTAPRALLQVGGTTASAIDSNVRMIVGNEFADVNSIQIGSYDDNNKQWKIENSNGGLWLTGSGSSGQPSSTGINLMPYQTGNTAPTIDLFGNVGVGMTGTPDTRLHVYSSDASFSPNTAYDRVVVESNADTVLQLAAGTSSLSGIGFSDSNRNAGYLFYDHATNSMQFAVNGASEKVRIDSNGNVGVGFTSPQVHLDIRGDYRQAQVRATTPTRGAYFSAINGTSTAIVNIGVESDAGGEVGSGTLANAALFGSEGAHPIQFVTSNAPKMTILSGGNVGINNAAPVQQFQVNSTTSSFVVNSSGSVGIGMTSPAVALDVYGTSDTRLNVGDTFSNPDGYSGMIRLGDPANAKFTLQVGSRIGNFVTQSGWNYFQLGARSNHDLRLIANNTDVLTVSTGGNVGIGFTSPASKLHVFGSGAISQIIESTDNDALLNIKRSSSSLGSLVKFTTGATTDWNLGLNYLLGSSFALYEDGQDGSPALMVNTNGNVGIGTTDPIGLLHVAGNNTPSVFIENTGTSANQEARLNFRQGGFTKTRIVSFADNPWSSGNNRLSFITGDGSTERMVISNGGNVGIGTTGPGAKLEIFNSGGNADIRLGESSSLLTNIRWNQGSNRAEWDTDSYSYPIYLDGSNIVLQSSSSGNVGIGTSAPNTKLEVYGGNLFINTPAASPVLRLWANGGNYWTQSYNISNENFEIGHSGTSTPFVINQNGNVGIGFTSPLAALDVRNLISVGTDDTTNGQITFQTTGAETAPTIAASTGNLQLTTSTGWVVMTPENGIQITGNGTNIWWQANNGVATFDAYKSATRTSLTLTNTAGGVGAAADFYVANGNVGIGTSSPVTNLEINPSSNADIRAGTWADISGNGDGRALFSTNFYAQSNSTYKYSNTHGSIGYAGVDLNAGIIKFLNATGATTQNNTFTPVETMRITETGNVGIGTSGPGDLLHVRNGSGVANLRLEGNSGNPGVMFYVGSTLKAQVYEESGDDTLRLGTGTGAQTDLVINGSGNVGVGTAAPWKKLSVNAGANDAMEIASALTTGQSVGLMFGSYIAEDGYKKAGIFFERRDNNERGTLHLAVDSAADANNVAASDAKLSITSDGNVGIGTTSPVGPLHVWGNGTNSAFFLNGNVGIGTTTPGVKLDSLATSTQLRLSYSTTKYVNFTTSSAGVLTIAPDTGNSLVLDQSNVLRPAAQNGLDLGDATNTWSSIYFGNQSKPTDGSMTAPPYSFNSDPNTGMYSISGDILGFSTGGTARMAINSGGNVGIGTTSPTGELEVGSATGQADIYINSATGNNANLWLRSGNTDTLGFEAQSGIGGALGTFISNRMDGGSINFRTTSTTLGTRMTIASNGNVGINDESPSYTLEVNGTMNVTGALTCASGCSSQWARATSPINVIIPNTAGDSLGLLSGNVGIGTTNPAGKFQIYNAGGRFIKTDENGNGWNVQVNDNSIANLLFLRNTDAGADYGAAALFDLGYGGDSGTAGTTVTGAKIAAAQEQTFTSTASTQDAYLAFSTAQNGTLGERLRINSAGNVGIGTTGPVNTLDVKGNGLRIQRDGDPYTWLYMDNNHTSGREWALISHATGSIYGPVGGFSIHDNTANKARLIIDTNGNVGIGMTAPRAELDIVGASSGNLILSENNRGGRIVGAGDGDYNGMLGFDTMTTNAFTRKMTITSAGNVFINDSANANMTTGLTINQGGADNEILAFKSSDVAHGITTQMETDTWAIIKKISGTGGASFIVSGSDSDVQAVNISGLSALTSSDRTTSATGAIQLHAGLRNGTGVQSLGADKNLAVITDNGTVRYIFDSDGSAHADVEWTTYSDARLKSDIGEIPYGLNEVLQLQPSIYTKYSGSLDANGNTVLENNPRRMIGFMAQDVRALIPELVESVDETKAFYSLNDGKLTAVLVKAIQEQQGQILSLQTNTATSSAAIAALQTQTATDSAKLAKIEITDSGNVGIGTTDPGSYKLYVNGSGFLNDTAWTYASDSRLKENVASIGTGLDVIGALNPVTFDYINGGTNRSGFIAQEVAEVLPELVSQRPDGMLTLRTDEILPFAVKAIQELSDKISNLQIDADGTLIVEKLKTGSITLDPSLANTSVELADAGIVDSTTEPVIEIKSKLADLEKRLAALEEKDSVKESTSSAVASIASASAQLAQASSSAEINTGRDDIAWKLTAPDVLFATSSAQLANLQVHSEATVSGQLTAYNLNVSEGFKSFGKTALSDTVVAGTLTVDGTLSIENGSEINVIGKLYLQKSILADSLDILNGAFTFDKDGTLEAKGTVLATQFAVKKGSSTGKGTIVKGSLDTIIENTYVDEDSVILITPNKALNQTIAVADKIKGGFLVELAKAEETDITFDYLIVGVK